MKNALACVGCGQLTETETLPSLALEIAPTSGDGVPGSPPTGLNSAARCAVRKFMIVDWIGSIVTGPVPSLRKYTPAASNSACAIGCGTPENCGNCVTHAA